MRLNDKHNHNREQKTDAKCKLNLLHNAFKKGEEERRRYMKHNESVRIYKSQAHLESTSLTQNAFAPRFDAFDNTFFFRVNYDVHIDLIYLLNGTTTKHTHALYSYHCKKKRKKPHTHIHNLLNILITEIMKILIT